MRRRWVILLRAIGGVLLLALAVRGVDGRQVLQALSGLHAAWLFAAGLVLTCAIILKAWRWQMLLANVLPDVTLSHALGPLLLGQALNMLTWARAGDVARIVALRRQSKSSTVAITATVVGEKLVDTLAIGLLAVLLVGRSVYVPAQGVAVTLAVAATGLVLLAGAARWGGMLFSRVEHRLARHGRSVPARLRGWLAAGLNALQPMAHAQPLLAIYALTALIWGAALGANLLLFRALALALPAPAALLVLVLVFIGVTPGLMPTNIGPFYFMTALALEAYAVARAPALAYAALLHLLVTGIPVCGTLVYLWFKRGTRVELRRALAGSEPPA